MTIEYQAREAEFLVRTDALCEHTAPANCECAKCPCKLLCDWLCANAND